MATVVRGAFHRQLLALAVASSSLAVGCQDADDRPESWSYVYTAILAPSCATAACHANASSAKGLDLSTRTSAYAMLTGRTCDAPADLEPLEPERSFVRPFDPTGSQLVHMLRGDQILVMPPDQPLPAVEVEVVERWILAGAACD